MRLITTQYGYSDYDALNISVEKRYSNNFSCAAAYSLGYSRGITAGQGDTPQLQTLTDLHLDEYVATAGTDRTHNFTMSGRVEIPKTRGVTVSGTLRAMSGTPFTIQDDTLDTDRTASTSQPLPAGTYNPFPAAGEHVMTRRRERRRPQRRAWSWLRAARHARRLPRQTGRTPHAGHLLRDVQRHRSRELHESERQPPSDAGLPAADRPQGGTGFPRQSQIGLRLGF